jgi:hypothetical protein
MAGPWPDWHMVELKKLLDDRDSGSFSDIALALSLAVRKCYSRNACIGKARRLMGGKPSGRSIAQGLTIEVMNMRRAEKRRKQRWAAKPSLRQRYERVQEKKALRKRFAEGGMAKTAPGYRKHLPRLPEMTKNELRAMLAVAWANTAALELRPE